MCIYIYTYFPTPASSRAREPAARPRPRRWRVPQPSRGARAGSLGVSSLSSPKDKRPGSGGGSSRRAAAVHPTAGSAPAGPADSGGVGVLGWLVLFFFFKMWLPSSGGNAADLRPRTGNPITNHPPPARDPSPPPGTCPGAESRSGRGRWRRGGRPAVPPPVLPWFAAAGARRGPGITYSCVQAQRRTEVAGMKKAGPCSVGSGSQSRLPPSHLLPILANLIPTRFRNLGVGTHRLPHLRFVCLGSAVGPGPSCAGMRHRAV